MIPAKISKIPNTRLKITMHGKRGAARRSLLRPTMITSQARRTPKTIKTPLMRMSPLPLITATPQRRKMTIHSSLRLTLMLDKPPLGIM